MKLIVTVFFTIFMFGNLPDLNSALTTRLDSFNATAGNPIQYRVLGQTASDQGAIVYLQPVSRATSTPYPGIVDWAVAAQSGGQWKVYFPGDPGYTAAHDHLPPALLAQADSTSYTVHADPALTTAVSDYQFPWDDGAWATITRSYHVHGTGRIDFDLSGRDVTAAKDGVIVYANDRHQSNAYASAAWWYWNTIIIQHGAHEFSLYGHLAPGSIPQWIKDGCTADVSATNCAVPVKAGQVIALEGSTGYSSNPHLHLEFGQAFGIAAYRDVADDDHDGNRAEPVYAGYIYAEQNVGISGYTPTEVADWQFGTLQQAVHSALPPLNVNLIQNSDFSAGTDDWTPSGQINWSVQDGVLHITRLRTAALPDWALFYQNVAGGIVAHTPFEATLKLGNASSIAKTITVSVFNRSGKQYGSIECVFSIPANTPLTLYTIRGVTVNTWVSLRFSVSVNPPDGSPSALVDDISLQIHLHLSDLNATQCITPA